MRTIISTLIAAALVAGVPAASALAQGNSAVDEYTETIPGGGGDNASGSDDGGGGSPLPEDVAADFGAAGAEGTDAARVAEATGPDKGNANQSGPNDSAGGSNADAGVPGVVTEVLGSDSDSGMGILLPIVLGATLLAAIAFLAARRGGGSNTPA